MILVADSGSTKTDWRAVSFSGAEKKFTTVGINPFHQRGDDIESIIRNSELPELAEQVTKVFFYGAGCNYEDKIRIVHDSVAKIFTNAYVEVRHDLIAAARALCGRSEGITCILGTGSNSCYYDGVSIVRNRPSLGYVLGDEGSGAFIGKKFIQDFLYGKVPDSVRGKFVKEFPDLTIDKILDKVYSGYLPNRFLASFTKFIHVNISNPYLHGLVYECFYAFLDNHVCKYDKYKELPIHFVGSISFYFQDILKRVAHDSGISVGKIIKSPIDGLTYYHTQQAITNE
jgi:glucosamine kinase